MEINVGGLPVPVLHINGGYTENIQMKRMFAMSLAAQEGLRGQKICERAQQYLAYIDSGSVPYIY